MFWRFGSDDDSRPVDGDGLVERRVQPAVVGDQRRQRLDVGRAQLRVDPPLEQLVDHRVGRPELLEHRRVGRVAGLRPLALRQVQLEEQDLLELLGAAEVELVADVDVDLLLEPRDLGAELAVEDRRAPRGRGRRRRPPSGRAPGSAAARPRGTAARARPRRGGARAARGRRSRTAPRGPARAVAGSSVGRRQDLVEVLGDDVGDRLAAQRGVEDVRRDLRVERDRQRRRRRVLGEAPRRGAA